MRNGARDILVRPFSVDPVRIAARSEHQDNTISAHSAQSNPRLSPREEEILRCLLRGQTSEVIAKALKISRRTIDAHRANIYKKFGVRNRLQLMSRVRTVFAVER